MCVQGVLLWPQQFCGWTLCPIYGLISLVSHGSADMGPLLFKVCCCANQCQKVSDGIVSWCRWSLMRRSCGGRSATPSRTSTVSGTYHTQAELWLKSLVNTSRPSKWSWRLQRYGRSSKVGNNLWLESGNRDSHSRVCFLVPCGSHRSLQGKSLGVFTSSPSFLGLYIGKGRKRDATPY